MQASTDEVTNLAHLSCARTHRVNLAFQSIVRQLSREWPELTHLDVDALYVRDFVREYGLRPDIVLDYERYALGFNKAFFFKNLYKALVVLWMNRAKIRHDLPVIDVGCGAGVFAIAWIAIFDEIPNQLILIDQSKAQLGIAEKVLSILGVHRFDLRRGAYPGEFADLHGLRLYSYFFCKQVLQQSIGTRNEVAAWLGADAIVVDYHHVLTDLASLLSPSYDLDERIYDLTPPSGFEFLFNDTEFRACGLFCSRRDSGFSPSDDQL